MNNSPAAVHRRLVDQVVVAKQLDALEELINSNVRVEHGSLDALRAQMQAQADGLDLLSPYLHEFGSGDWAVHHMDITITHVGEFMGQMDSGRMAHLNEVEAARVVDGRIVEMWSVADVVGAMVQLGLPIPDGG